MNNEPNPKITIPSSWPRPCSPQIVPRPSARSGLALTAIALASVVLMALPAQAALMAYEGFNYPTGSGNLTGLAGGFGWNGAWQGVNNGSSSVQSASLVGGANAPSGYDAFSTGKSVLSPNNTRTGRSLDTSAGGIFDVKGYRNGSGNIGVSGKTIYVSFLQQPNGTTSYYEFEFHRGNLGDPGRIGGIGNDSGASTSVFLRVPSAGQTVIGAGSTSVNFYVVRIDYLSGNDTVSVYQNPTSATEPVAATLVETNSGDMSFSGISVGCFNNGRTVTHDEVRVGETWADVVSPAVSSAGNWDGGGADNNWNTAGNWDNDVVPVFATSLTFAGSTRLVNTNNLTGVAANSITFDAAAGAFTLAGNSLGLNGNIGFSGNPAAPITQTISLPLVPSRDITINTPTNGNLVLSGNVTSGSWLTKTGNGTLTLGGTNTFATLSANGGTNIITGNTAFTGGGGRRWYVADGDFINGVKGTVIIQPGATVAVTGNYDDAGVLGRDSGSGTIIQNGGTFTFNMANQSFLFIGASGSTATRSEYDMNGGVLDMSGKTLGIALGVNVLVTGLVNQVSGVITNVGQLYFNPFFTQGHGIYNLTGGSLYIGSGGIISFAGSVYEMNLGGGTVGAVANWSSAVNMTLTGINGPVTFNPSGNTITLSGSLSGSGGLTVNGLGVLDLSGANTYTGDTTVTAGSTLQLDVTGTSFGAFKLANGSLLNLNYSGTRVVAACFTNGVALAVGTYNAGNLPGFITGSGDLQVASGISKGIWDGGGANNNWSTAGNWDQDSVPVFPIDVTFTGSARLNNNNDLSGITVGNLTFTNNAGAFTIGGNDITLSGGIGFSGNPAAPITQTVNLGMTWTANETIDLPPNANLTLGGNINASANGLTKFSAGTLTLGGTDTFNSYILNGGTNVINGNVTVSGTGGSIYLGNINTNYNGTLVIQPGATLTVNGTFNDAFVIGRDGGSGKIIQNGGTFSYSNPSHSYIFVGATSHTGTQAEYDMNGGVLDMNGDTLGIALGDSGVVYDGTLNQTGGAINNVFQLSLGAVRAYGHGIYNLTGGSIAIDFGGINSDSGSYALNLGGGTISAISSWSSALNPTLTGLNGPVTFNTAGNTITLSGALSGPGGLTVSGGGVLELSGSATYSGDTTVSSGFLQLDTVGSSAGAFRVVDGGLFNLNFTGNYVVTALYTNGVALPNGIYNSANLPTFIAGSGNIQVVANVSAGIWDGGGTDNNWSTAGNWDHNALPIFPHSLFFGGTTRLNNNNDLTGITVTSLIFSNDASAFTIGGNDITLSGGIGFNANPAAPITQTVNLGMTWTGNETIDLPANGNLSLGGNISAASYKLTQTSAANAGILTLGGSDALAGLIINGGTNRITGTTTVAGTGGGSQFYLANGSTAFKSALIIENGASLSVSGAFGDAAVIGRDGGVGTVIQNGGTFDFNINDGSHEFLFVGASGNPNTRAIYDMNGGVLNMNGKTLGIALGANVLVTGVVNQVGGVITNVGNLFFDPFFVQGHGIYNLTGGSIYIGAGGITVQSGGGYEMNLGGGTVGAYANWASTLNMVLTGANGSANFDPAGNTITLSGLLSGSGGLTLSSAGTLELSSANAYTGDTTVKAGVLQLDAAGTSSSAIRITNGATLNLNYGGSLTVPAAYTNGVALAAGVYMSGNLPGFITGAGSLTVAAAAPPVVNAPHVSNGNLILTGSGGSPNSSYTWLTSTNLAAPIASWVTNFVGSFDGSGNFSNAIPINAASPGSFFRLRTP